MWLREFPAVGEHESGRHDGDCRGSSDGSRRRDGDGYYGFHPYPDPPLTGTPTWEISIGGGDTLIDPVVFDQWYVQVAMCYKSEANAYNTYYWNWPDTTTDTVAWVGPPYSPGPTPAIVLG